MGKHKARKRRRQKRIGDAPGTMKVPLDASPTKVHVLAYGPDMCEEKTLDDLAELDAFAGRFPVVWIDVTGLSDIELLQRIGERHELHRLALEDIVNIDQRPKVEAYPNGYFMCMRMMSDPSDIDGEQLSLFFTHTVVLTFQERPGDVFGEVRDRIRQARGRVRTAGTDYLAYVLLDAVVDAHFPVLERFVDEVESIEEQVLSNPSPAILTTVQQAKRQLLGLRRDLWHLRDAVSTLNRDERGAFAADTQPYLRDCYDHIVRLLDIVESHRDIVGGLVDLYLSMSSQRMNEVIKVLTIMSALFIPLSFVAGVYGMNFNTSTSPWNMPELDWIYGYPFALGVMLAMASGLMLFFRRRGWLQ